MPKGPRGEKRPADVVGAAVKIMKIATGEITEDLHEEEPQGRKGGQKGGKARAKKLSKKRRREIAQRAAAARWRDKSK